MEKEIKYPKPKKGVIEKMAENYFNEFNKIVSMNMDETLLVRFAIRGFGRYCDKFLE